MRTFVSAAMAAAILLSTSAFAGPPQLEQRWVMEGFAAPEGAAEAPDGTYLISNVSGGGSDFDGEGWISKISADGQLIEDKWAAGLNAPKGMVVHEGVLYVADIDRVRTYDAPTGVPGRVIVIEGAKFLNDVTVYQGQVLISDSANARIYGLTDTGIEIWLEDEEKLGGVNGLLGDGERLLISTMTTGSLFEANVQHDLTEIATGMEDADGIGIVPGGYLVSAWRGEVYFVSDDGEVTSLLNTREEGILQNDLSVFGDLVIVPNWQPGTVTGWQFEK